jgi:hypothetical protein
LELFEFEEADSEADELELDDDSELDELEPEPWRCT